MQIRTATTERQGVRTFYVAPLTPKVGVEDYVVKAFSRRMTCTCQDYVHRGQVEQHPCKHVNLVKLLAKAAGGMRHVPHGATLRFTLTDTVTVQQRRRRTVHA